MTKADIKRSLAAYKAAITKQNQIADRCSTERARAVKRAQGIHSRMVAFTRANLKILNSIE